MKVIRAYKKGQDLREFLEREKWLAYTEIVDFIAREGFTDKEVGQFEDIGKEILRRDILN